MLIDAVNWEAVVPGAVAPEELGSLRPEAFDVFEVRARKDVAPRLDLRVECVEVVADRPRRRGHARMALRDATKLLRALEGTARGLRLGILARRRELAGDRARRPEPGELQPEVAVEAKVQL